MVLEAQVGRGLSINICCGISHQLAEVHLFESLLTSGLYNFLTIILNLQIMPFRSTLR